MRIKSLGWTNKNLDQISRINCGFQELEHILVEDEDCDFIFCNDSSEYNLAIEYKNKYPNAKLILNVLDIPPHCLDIKKYDISKYPYVQNTYGRVFDV